MTSHRLDPIKGAMLKQIAGLIQKLSYRDMQELGDAVSMCMPGGGLEGAKATEALLGAADRLLSPSVTKEPGDDRLRSITKDVGTAYRR